MEKMREATVHWILMHEHPHHFGGRGFQLYDEAWIFGVAKDLSDDNKEELCNGVWIGKRKLKNMLRHIQKVSLTTDLWKIKESKDWVHGCDRALDWCQLETSKKGAKFHSHPMTSTRSWHCGCPFQTYKGVGNWTENPYYFSRQCCQQWCGYQTIKSWLWIIQEATRWWKAISCLLLHSCCENPKIFIFSQHFIYFYFPFWRWKEFVTCH